ncbi:hypothetical protein Bhyg_06944 [Pseudolycoriella hygida]|uniref:Uncharacterized protein n=1 Tax=Pseudolycoriella hygida TaxID=35572 RepID=A0A9Q0S2D6_9DIPT|nr:hypothetical protein Bhyg_06944 [Pseudolycoriella hygida]
MNKLSLMLEMCLSESFRRHSSFTSSCTIRTFLADCCPYFAPKFMKDCAISKNPSLSTLLNGLKSFASPATMSSLRRCIADSGTLTLIARRLLWSTFQHYQIRWTLHINNFDLGKHGFKLSSNATKEPRKSNSRLEWVEKDNCKSSCTRRKLDVKINNVDKVLPWCTLMARVNVHALGQLRNMEHRLIVEEYQEHQLSFVVRKHFANSQKQQIGPVVDKQLDYCKEERFRLDVRRHLKYRAMHQIAIVADYHLDNLVAERHLHHRKTIHNGNFVPIVDGNHLECLLTVEEYQQHRYRLSFVVRKHLYNYQEQQFGRVVDKRLDHYKEQRNHLKYCGMHQIAIVADRHL